MLLVMGLWAIGSLPEYLVALLFFVLAILLKIASPAVIFSGFASGTLWLVLGGLITSTALTLLVLPALYARFGHWLLPARDGSASSLASLPS